ncbi:hypothetical protein EVAR_5987_1 [Eumeta japonica]|uniref:Uncharacterized protein n=1 Tax=Eumeta variegata TaxID=151549 RepID=A0A4C1TCW7_EUMVA|nr:hypothetical protein EVAR_5987_1 [Eumeta japonica]
MRAAAITQRRYIASATALMKSHLHITEPNTRTDSGPRIGDADAWPARNTSKHVRNQLYERVKNVGPLGRGEKSRADPTVSPDRVTHAFHCDIVARNHSNVPKKVLLLK